MTNIVWTGFTTESTEGTAIKRLRILAVLGTSAVVEINDITGQIVDSAIKVHRALGPGLLESTYEACLIYELTRRGLQVRNQVPLPVRYGDVFIEVGYRIDLLVADSVIIELKSVDEIAPIHKAQLLSYLKLSGHKVGLLINFNVELLKHGITRMIH